MAKVKTKIVILEGETTMSNRDLATYVKDLNSGAVPGNSANFLLTQQPRVQEVKSPKGK